ncbi:hypothetical protein MCHI_002211 [Candidatus Magnetoovum chiemensis]|nr:hypothetical protein MCHI_002211 [Candidatus Magnetoovum chiemensis]
MPSQEAADKISSIDEELAAVILLKMNPRKAGKAMALMDTRKASALTQKMASIKNNQQQ